MLKLDELSDLENCRVSQLLMIPVDSAWILGISWNICKTFHNDGCRGKLSEYWNVSIVIPSIRLCQGEGQMSEWLKSAYVNKGT